MPRYKKGIRNNCFHQNYTHDVLFPGATFRTRHNGECAILGRSDDKSRRGYYVVEFKDSGIIIGGRTTKVTDDTKILRRRIYW